MSSELVSPVGADEFALLLEKFLPLPSKIAVAVSGGADSMALAFCLKRWSQCELIALIVDHGLREGSAVEALEVKTRLEHLNIESKILHWEHAAVEGRLHEQARQARYHLLTDACHQMGITDLFVAHHKDDQAETILMRLAKGSGIEGLSGMKAQAKRDHIRLLRPFLHLPKQRLVATCETQKLTYVSDPSNFSNKFARGRLRKIMPLLISEGMNTENLITLGARAAEAHTALEYYTHAFLKTAANCEIGGSIRLNRASLRDVPRAIALQALGLSLRYIHDDGYAPEYAALSAILDIILDLQSETVRTLNGCIISISEEKILLMREPSAVTENLILSNGQTLLWDKRWLVSALDDSPSRQSYRIRPLGSPPHDVLDRLTPTLRRLIPQGRVRSTLPAIYLGDALHAIPSFDATALFHMIYQKQAFP